MKKNVLTDKQIDTYCKKIGLDTYDWDEGGGFVHEAVIRVVEQAKRKVAEKIFERIEAKRLPFTRVTSDRKVCILLQVCDYESLRTEFLGKEHE